MRIVLCWVLCLPLFALAQTGPGGVGDSGSNIFWLDANEISGFADGDDLDTWVDVSGNDLDLTQNNVTRTPEYRTGVLNGYPVVTFNKTTGTYGRLRRTGLSSFPTTAITQFIVNANSGESGEAQTSYASAANNNDFLIFNSSNLSIYRGSSTSTGVSANDGNWHIINPSWRSSDGDTRMWLDGTQRYSTTFRTGSSITANGCFAIAGEQDAVDAGYVASQAHLGDFAEVLVFNFRLNQAQRIIVNNYLAAKYAIALAGNDYFAYELSHSIDVAGIGRETASEMHTAAMSDDILEVSNPSNLNANQEYLLFGHDNGDVSTAWTTSEAPDAGATVQRLAREWRFSEINGDVGEIDIMVDVASLPAIPVGFSSYGIMIDSDGDFSSGATVYELAHDTGTEYDLSGLNIADGDFIAICAIDPKVNFTVDHSSGFEPSNASFEISVTYIPAANITVEYSTADGTALSSQPDYTAVSAAVATIAAGSTSTTFTILINDEAVLESDETFSITLANPSAGVDVGSIGTHTYTIHDDDDPRKIYFNTSTSSGNEGLSPVSVTVSMNSTSATDVTVDYLVTGGTATEGSDFMPISGTLTIAGGSGLTTGSFTFNIIDDAVYELSETITISLSNPVGANLDLPSPNNVGTGIVDHVYTIIDNDVSPVVQFTTVSATVAEASASALIEVELDLLSEVDATINYTVADGSANSGTDYTLASGTLVIPAGSSSAFILATIINNANEELPETFTVTIASASNATLGANLVFTQTILDDDQFGYRGPGGVGDDKSNKLWVSADHGVYNDAGTTAAANGNRTRQWNDRSGNNFHLSQPAAAFRPIYRDNGVNGKPVMRFNVSNNRIRRTSFTDFPTSEITTISVMNTATGNDAHVSYATPVDNNHYLLFNSANQRTFIAGASTATGHSYADGDWHILGHTWRSSDGQNRLYEDGTQVYAGAISSGRTMTAGGCIAIGGEQDAVDGGYDASQDFDGEIAETIIYNQKLNTAQRIIVDNYLAAKYDLAIRNDLYAHETVYGHEVAGIGRVDANNFHADAQGSAILRVLNPTDLEDGEFMIWGHDDGIEQAIEITDVPLGVEGRFSRVWRMSETDMTGTPTDVGSVDINWDLSGKGPVTVTDLRLLIDTDNDGLFSDETAIAGAVSVGGDVYQFAGVTALRNNLRFTLGTLNSGQTPLPIELVEFSAKLTTDESVKLDWTTASEINNDFFTIERSDNLREWEEVIQLPGAGNSSTELTYTAYDYAPLAGRSYYRLKQTDFDGQFSHSAVISIKHELGNTIRVFPNPVVDKLTLIAGAAELEELQILNALGQDVTGQTTFEFESNERLIINTAGLAKGTYFIRTKTMVHKVYKQ